MNKKEKVRFIEETLNAYFPSPEIPLKHVSPFTLLVAVVLSAQATDAKVNEVTPHLFKKASTPEEMAKLTVEEVREIIKPIGLSNTKAKALVNLSKMLIEKWNGEVPSTLEELEQLPGVGHKTASVLMVQSFAKAAFPVDTHIHRLAKRWGLSSGANVKQTEEDLKKAFPKKHWGKVHLQMIYFGRKFCKALGHDSQKCPICSVVAPR
jgi:endonuclease III